MTRLRAGDATIELSSPLLMGVVNATPDSFSDAGRTSNADQRIAVGMGLLEAGADIIDIGGQSMVTGVPEIPADEEIRRALPVIEGIRERAPHALISVETYRGEVARAAVEAGASIINDVTSESDPALLAIAAASGAAVVVTHNMSKPKQRLTDPAMYSDVVEHVLHHWQQRVAGCLEAGISREAIILDPGPDFSKTPSQTVAVLRARRRLADLGFPLLFAISRKDFIGAALQRPPSERDAGSLGAIAVLREIKHSIFRVHDVRAVRDFLYIADLLEGRVELHEDLLLDRDLWRSGSA